MNLSWLDHRRTQRMAYELVTGECTDERLLRHADQCPACTATFAELREAIDLVEQAVDPVDQRSESYWAAFGQRVLQRIDADERRRVRRAEVSPKHAFVAGLVTAASIIVAALILWRSSGTDQEHTGASPSVPAVSVRDRAYDYLERSRVVLVGVLNEEPQDLHRSPELVRRRGAASRALVEEGRDLDLKLTGPDDARLRQLVNELEVILVQLANLETEQDIPGLEIIRDGVDRRGVLLKIAIEEMDRPSAPTDTPSSATNKTTSRSL